MKTVCIQVDDEGKYSVGLQPEEGSGDSAENPAEEASETPEQEAGEQDSSYLQPAKSLDDALAQAKQLLATPDDQGQADQDMAAGFKSVNGAGLNGNNADTGGYGS